MLAVIFALSYVMGDIDNTEAHRLFDRETKLSAPVNFAGKFGLPSSTIKAETDAIVENVPEFKEWYNTDYFEMDDNLKTKITNTLNANVKSIDDLDSFWLITESPYLEAKLAKLSNNITKLQTLMDTQNIKYNTAKRDLDFSTLSLEERNIWLINKATYIVENLKAGLKNHEDNRFPDVFKNFLTAVVEKKKIDAVFSKLVLSL